MLPCVFVAYDPQQTTYLPLLVVHRSAEQDSSAELPVLDSESQSTCDLAKLLQPDDFAVLYAKKLIVLTNHY